MPGICRFDSADGRVRHDWSGHDVARGARRRGRQTPGDARRRLATEKADSAERLDKEKLQSDQARAANPLMRKLTLLRRQMPRPDELKERVASSSLPPRQDYVCPGEPGLRNAICRDGLCALEGCRPSPLVSRSRTGGCPSGANHGSSAGKAQRCPRKSVGHSRREIICRRFSSA